MTDTITTLSDVMPSAAPSEADIAAWQALPRDEQLRRMRLSVADPACSRISGATMGDILARAKARAAKRRHG